MQPREPHQQPRRRGMYRFPSTISSSPSGTNPVPSINPTPRPLAETESHASTDGDDDTKQDHGLAPRNIALRLPRPSHDNLAAYLRRHSASAVPAPAPAPASPPPPQPAPALPALGISHSAGQPDSSLGDSDYGYDVGGTGDASHASLVLPSAATVSSVGSMSPGIAESAVVPLGEASATASIYSPSTGRDSEADEDYYDEARHVQDPAGLSFSSTSVTMSALEDALMSALGSRTDSVASSSTRQL
ncbi:hypothetical protein GQ42DRAFT_82906 [Ramicandelaber brevisporus]|nr:hypothetical protein GQ42DRAFT_82906 [Ramicandelaber brevisporus]